MTAPTTEAWILAGATATGKSAVAQWIAQSDGCSILSADAMLVYKGMDIGTAKPSPEERGKVPYFGLDLVSPSEPFSTGRWLDSAIDACTVTPERKLIVAGGTGLYIKALTDGLEGSVVDPDSRLRWRTVFEKEGLAGLQQALRERAPQAFQTLDNPLNPRRLLRALEHLDATGTLPEQWKKKPMPSVPIIALSLSREQLHRRIARRTEQMFKKGLIEEVRHLRNTFPHRSSTAARAIGYAEAGAVIDQQMKLDEAIERTIIRTRQLAKRQETWLRHQAQVCWLMIADDESVETIAQRVKELWRHHGPTPLFRPQR